jgi:hypothetical protein
MTRDLTEFTVDDMAGYFRMFVAEVSNSPLYAALCPLMADDSTALALYTDVPGTQRRPNLLLAALHFSVLRDPSHNFAGWFKTVDGRPSRAGGPHLRSASSPATGFTSDRQAGSGTSSEAGGPHLRSASSPATGFTSDRQAGSGTRAPEDPELKTALSSFITQRFDELKELVVGGATQTNEVGRSALILPALAVLREEQAKPVAIVEIGTSAGLNLRPDAYSIHYKNADGTTTNVGPENSTVQIETDSSQSAASLPYTELASLQIGTRIGVDLNPLDVTDEFQARWLCALIWPDDTARFHRLQAAVEHAAANPIPIVQGDAVETVGAHISSVPADEYPVVVTTWVLTYLTEPQRRAFAQALDAAAQTRDFAWIAMEHPAYAMGLPWPEEVTALWGSESLDPIAQTITKSGTPLVVHRYKDGIRSSEWIASVHAHGHWINWHPVPT